MKKLISAIICISMLLSVVPMVSQAVEVTTPVFVDFEDYAAGVSNSYKDGYIVFPSTSYETPTIDAEHGKSIKLYSPATGSTEYMNLASELTQNAVFGFSYYSDDSTPSFIVSSKVTNAHKNEKGWIDVNSIATITGYEIKVGSTTLSDISYTKGTWINFAFAMDYINHKVDVYIDGKYVASHTPKTGSSNFLGTDRFNLSIVAGKYSDTDNTKAAALYFDNMFVYYPPNSITTKVTGNPGDSAEKDEITVDFGQNVILPSGTSYVTLNGDEVEAEPVVKHGYVTGLKIKNLSLEGGTEYTVAFPGVADFLGNGISNCVFATDSVEPQISISRKTPDAVYEVGDSAEFEIESAYLGGNNIVIYLNDEIYDTISANATEFSVELVGGDNEIYAKVSELSLESNKIEIFVDNTPSLFISKQGTNSSYSAGDRVKFNIISANLDGNTIEFYNNGTLVDTVGEDTKEVTVEIESGYNKVFAKVPALDIKTDLITILAEAMGPAGEVKFYDFNDNIMPTNFYNRGEKEGSITLKDSEDDHGKSLYFYLDGTSVATDDYKPHLVVESFEGDNKTSVYSFEADLKFSNVQKSGSIFPLKCQKNGKKVDNNLYTLSGGWLSAGSQKMCEIKPDVWYNFRATWNSDTNTSDFYVNGEKKASGVEFKNRDIDCFLYVNTMMVCDKDAKYYMYMDNIKSCFLAKMPNAELIAGSDATEVPYENTAITLKFDQAMNADSLKGIKLTSEIGKEILIDFATDDNLTFIANVASLSPNTTYNINLSGVVAQSGVGVSSDYISFKTKKPPLAIKSVKTTALGNSLKVDASIQNNNAEEKSYIVIAALYSGNMMLSSDAKAYTSIADETPSFSFDKPNGDYEMEIYVFDSAKSLNLIDKLIVK